MIRWACSSSRVDLLRHLKHLLTDAVCKRIRTAIVEGPFVLGEQMSEAQVAKRLGVSKTPVREAPLRLKADGLMEIQPQRGSFVFRLDAVGVGQLCSYRATIETAALVTAMKKAERTRELKALARLDMDVHWQWFAHCPNRYLLAGYDVVRRQLVAMRHRAPIDNTASRHQVRVDAIGGGDVEQACTLLVGHVLENERRYAGASRVAAP